MAVFQMESELNGSRKRSRQAATAVLETGAAASSWTVMACIRISERICCVC
jgi:hypothetical protein